MLFKSVRPLAVDGARRRPLIKINARLGPRPRKSTTAKPPPPLFVPRASEGLVS